MGGLKEKAMEKFKIEPEMDAAAATASRDTVCGACGKKIAAEERVVWVADEGVFHEECVERVEARDSR